MQNAITKSVGEGRSRENAGNDKRLASTLRAKWIEDIVNTNQDAAKCSGEKRGDVHSGAECFWSCAPCLMD